jgi:hypothetical protein
LGGDPVAEVLIEEEVLTELPEWIEAAGGEGFFDFGKGHGGAPGVRIGRG